MSLTSYSDNNWEITQPSLSQMINTIEQIIETITLNNDIEQNSVKVSMDFSFTQSLFLSVTHN